MNHPGIEAYSEVRKNSTILGYVNESGERIPVRSRPTVDMNPVRLREQLAHIEKEFCAEDVGEMETVHTFRDAAGKEYRFNGKKKAATKEAMKALGKNAKLVHSGDIDTGERDLKEEDSKYSNPPKKTETILHSLRNNKSADLANKSFKPKKLKENSEVASYPAGSGGYGSMVYHEGKFHENRFGGKQVKLREKHGPWDCESESEAAQQALNAHGAHAGVHFTKKEAHAHLIRTSGVHDHEKALHHLYGGHDEPESKIVKIFHDKVDKKLAAVKAVNDAKK